jgi:glycosyltransferase involved in cell wall biosynthesis
MPSKFKKGLVSVIIPVYNREHLVEDAILSVYSQSYRPIECVVVDDGSTDGSVKKIEALRQKLRSDDFTIICVVQSNGGAPKARNTGIQYATGEFIQFLDSDDLLYPDKIESHVKFLKHNMGYDGVYGDWHHGTAENFQLIKAEKWEDRISQFYCGRVIHTLSFLFRRAIIDKIGLWDEQLKRNQEIDYFLRGVLAGGNFDYLPCTTGLWRVHEGDRIVSSSGAKNALAFHDKWIKELDRLGLFTEAFKKRSAQYFFWYALELEGNFKDLAIEYLYKAHTLYPDIQEFNTPKMKLLRTVLGSYKSIKVWYKKAKNRS